MTDTQHNIEATLSKDYNILRPKLKQPEYGRLVTQMVEYALTIEDAQQRQLYAERIIETMRSLHPQMRNVNNYKIKLWEHLAFISDYKLDIEYPIEIKPKESHNHHQRLSYPGNKVEKRHYGFLIEEAARKLSTLPDSKEKEEFLTAIIERMKKYLYEWKGDVATDERIIADISHYLEGNNSHEKLIETLEQIKNATSKDKNINFKKWEHL